MNPKWNPFALAAFLLLVASRAVAAQCDSCRVAILSLPAGARPLGLGDAYVAGDGPNALFYNAAQVGSNHGSAFTVEAVGSATLAEFATTANVGHFGFGTGIRFLSRSDNTVVADSANLRGGALVAGVGLATQVHGVWLGGVANFVSQDLGADGGGAAFDVGAAVRQFGLRIGLSAQNLGRDLRDNGVRDELPTRVSLGAALPTTSISTYFDLAASAALSWERGNGLVPKGGVELTYEPVSGWTFTGRVGVRRTVSRLGELRQSALSVGGSFGLNAVSLDYAFQPGVAAGQAVQSLGIRVQ
jgi:hypothetical protein